MASDHQKRVYVRDRKGRFAETGMLNAKLKTVAKDMLNSGGTPLAQRITLRNHGITDERQKKKVIGHYKALLAGHRRRNAGKLLTSNVPVSQTRVTPQKGAGKAAIKGRKIRK